MKEIEKSKAEAEEITSPSMEFKGYTLEELRYQRAFVTLQKEFCKSKLLRGVEKLKKTNPLSPSSAAENLPGKVGFVATKLLTGLNYLDYAVLGFTAFSSIRKALSIFKRKKK